MSVTLGKTDKSEAYVVQIYHEVDLKEDGSITEMNIGEFLKIVCLKGLLESDITICAGKRYRVQGTICIQDVTEDETDGPQG